MNDRYLRFSFVFLVIVVYLILQPTNVIFADQVYVPAQIYSYKAYHRIKAYIGTKSQNRINFGNYGIKEIIGDDRLYQVIHDTQGHNLFIIPKTPAGEVIDITIVSNGNKAQDLSLKVIDDLGQTIVIEHDILKGEIHEK
jgi:hypothetical protein